MSHTDSGDCRGGAGVEKEVHALADTAVATRRRALERVAESRHPVRCRFWQKEEVSERSNYSMGFKL